jgi:hypothetical protein
VKQLGSTASTLEHTVIVDVEELRGASRLCSSIPEHAVLLVGKHVSPLGFGLRLPVVCNPVAHTSP